MLAAVNVLAVQVFCDSMQLIVATYQCLLQHMDAWENIAGATAPGPCEMVLETWGQRPWRLPWVAECTNSAAQACREAFVLANLPSPNENPHGDTNASPAITCDLAGSMRDFLFRFQPGYQTQTRAFNSLPMIGIRG